MGRVVGALVLLVTLAFGVGAGQADELARAPRPGWAEMRAIPEVTPDRKAGAYDGFLNLVDDWQARFDDEGRTVFLRRVVTATTRSGLERAAIVQEDYDPELDDLALTHLVIHRGGQLIDVARRVKPVLLRRELSLEDGIIDGTLTLHIQVPGVKVGDLVDAGFLVRHRPPVPGMVRYYSSVLDSGDTAGVWRTDILWPKAWPLRQGPLPPRIKVEERDEGDHVRRIYTETGDPAPYAEDGQPVEEDQSAFLDLSGWYDWGPLVTAMSPYYQSDYPLTPEWEEKLAAIKAAGPDDAHRVIAALRLVQDEIRYVGIEVGRGGYYARLPAEVADAGFGDCKDKSLLLRTLLTRMGIRADAALTDLDYGRALDRRLPSAAAFDHMIVKAVVDGQTYWMDPTGYHEGGRLDLAVTPDTGFALPLDGHATALEQLVPTPEMAYRRTSREVFTFTPLGMFLTVTTDRRGTAANAERARWAESPEEDITGAYLEYYQGNYPGIMRSAPVKKTDDLEENRLTVVEYYYLPATDLKGTDLWTAFPLVAPDIDEPFDWSPDGPRQGSLDASPIRRLEQYVTVIGAPSPLALPDPVDLTAPGFSYRFGASRDALGATHLSWELQVTKDRIAAADGEATLEAGAKVTESVHYDWDLSQEDEAPLVNTDDGGDGGSTGEPADP